MFKKKFIHRKKILSVLAVSLLLGLAAGCSDRKNTDDEFIITRQDAAESNIIMIVVDTLRADHLSTYGYTRNTDPNIAEFRKQAVVFHNAVSAAPWTTPSYTSLLLGKFAYNHNMNTPYDENQQPDGVMLTSYFKNAGYKNVSAQTNELLSFLSNGDYFDEAYNYLNETEEAAVDKGAIDKMTQWLDNDLNITTKFFLFMGLMSPHWTYRTDTGYLEEFVGDDLYYSTEAMISDVNFTHTECWTYDMLSADLQSLVGEPQNSIFYRDARLYIAGYDSEIKYADYQIGRLLQKLKDKGLYDSSLIIITADHGENMTDHPVNFAHGDNLFQSLLHVPLLIKFPNQNAQREITDFVRTIDVLPTVLDYLGVAFGGTDGKSLLPLINRETVNYDERPVISYRIATSGTGDEEVSVIRNGYKLIRNKLDGTEQLYDLTSDSDETNDISLQYPNEVSQMKDFLVSAGSFTAW